MSCKYLNEDCTHVEKKYMQKFSGNFIFASLNSCRGYNKSRRDDIQSLIYIMVYLLNNSNLPWSEFHKIFKNGNYEFNDYLRKRLDIKYTKDFFKLSPKSLRDIIKRVLTLQFDEEPPYDTICDKLRQEISKEIPIDQNNQANNH